MGDVTREHVAEIARRHAERDRAVGAAERERRGEVIDDLRDDAGPVDRVHARKRDLVAERRVAEHGLHEGLAVVEVAVDRDGVDVAPLARGHLPPLDGTHATVREQDEDVRPVAAREGVDRRAAGIARGRADDRRATVGAREEVVHQAREQLHRHVLECQRAAVVQLHHVRVGADLHEGCDRGVREGGVGLLDHAAKRGFVDLAGRERGDHLVGDLGIGAASKRPHPLHREPGILVRHIKATIGGQSRQNGIGEAEARGLSAGGDVLQGPGSGAGVRPSARDALAIGGARGGGNPMASGPKREREQR